MRRHFFADTIGKTVFGWALLFCVLGGVAGFFVNFIPSKDLMLPALLFSALAAGYCFSLWLSLLRKRPDAFPAKRGIKYFTIVTIGFCVLAFILFLLLFVTVPAIITEAFGTPYQAEDRVIEVSECRGRRCGFCTRELWLERNRAFNRFCPEGTEWEHLKAGSNVLVVGFKSPLGFRIKSFRQANSTIEGDARKSSARPSL